MFHQLDVTHPATIASLADFIKTKFGKLDILVRFKIKIIENLKIHDFVFLVESAG